MSTRKSDIRDQLEEMMSEIQQKSASLRVERDKIDDQLRDADSALIALRTVYEIESKKVGENKAPLFVGKGVTSRFTGMRLIDAIRVLKKENPLINKREAHKKLMQEGFDFKGKRSLSAVHFAWINLDRQMKG